MRPTSSVAPCGSVLQTSLKHRPARDHAICWSHSGLVGRRMRVDVLYNITSVMWATFANMHACPWEIRHHPVILRPVSAPESAYLGPHIGPQPENRPSARQPLKRPFRVEKRPLTPKCGFPVQSDFFAVISNPNTQAESTGFEKSRFGAPVHSEAAESKPKRRPGSRFALSRRARPMRHGKICSGNTPAQLAS